MTIDELITWGDHLMSTAHFDGIESYVDYENFDEWRRMALMFLQQYYPQHPQTKTFEGLIGGGIQKQHVTAIWLY